MKTIQQNIEVRYSYAVHFTDDLFAPQNLLLRDVVRGDSETAADALPRQALFALDSDVQEHHPRLAAAIAEYCRRHRDVLTLAGPLLVLPGGESVKNQPQHLATLHAAINAAGIDRHSFVVAIGGGALLDVAGYAAATAHRGVRLIRVPTTVLAQNDSGVGVKNGINAFGKKNFLGSFAPPCAVLNDSRFLTTLSDRDWKSGIAEAIKVALIKDAAFFVWLEEHAPALARRDMATMQHLIYRCAELHLQHIAGSGDPFEIGSSRPLDFGHWAAHKLEQLTDYRLRHGEAVAIGIALDATYSHLIGLLPAADYQRIVNLLSRLGFAPYAPESGRFLDQPEHPLCILGGLREFREHLGGQLTIMLLQHIGEGVEVHEIDAEIMVESVRQLERLAEGARAVPVNGTATAQIGKEEQSWNNTPALAR